MVPRLALVVATLSVAAAPAAAAEVDYTPGSPAFQAAVAVSAAHWGALPCGGQVAYGVTDLPGDTIGMASWRRPVGRETDATSFTTCRVDFDPVAIESPETFCTTLAHELGHLLGHDHADDPADLMAAQIAAPLPACVRAMAPWAQTQDELIEVHVADVATKPRAAKRKRAGRRAGAAKRSRRAAQAQRRAAQSRRQS